MKGKLYRSEKDKVLAGVCGGLGEYFDTDPVLVRLAFLLFTFVGGGGVLLYIILAIVIPKGENGPGGAERKEELKHMAHEAGEKIQEVAKDMGASFKNHRAERRWNLLGILLVVVGLMALANEILPGFWFGRRFFWPGLLVVVGFYFLLRGRRNSAENHHIHEHGTDK